MKKIVTDDPKTAEDFRLNFAFEKDGKLLMRTLNGIIDFNNLKMCHFKLYECEGDIETACMTCDYGTCPIGLLEKAVIQAATLRHQLKKYEDAEEDQGWRDAKLHKPKDREPVLLYCVDGGGNKYICAGFYRNKYVLQDVIVPDEWVDDHKCYICTQHVLYWMPQPEPPKEE